MDMDALDMGCESHWVVLRLKLDASPVTGLFELLKGHLTVWMLDAAYMVMITHRSLHGVLVRWKAGPDEGDLYSVAVPLGSRQLGISSQVTTALMTASL